MFGFLPELAPSSASLLRLAATSCDLYLANAVSSRILQSSATTSSLLSGSHQEPVQATPGSGAPAYTHQTRGFNSLSFRGAESAASPAVSFGRFHSGHAHNETGWAALPHSVQQLRGYKSNKRSLKRLNTAASWKAAAPFLPAKDATQDREPPPGPVVDSCIPPIPEVPKPVEVSRVGAITGQYKLELQQHYAVIEVLGKQFKVTPDDIIFIDQLPGVQVNDVLSLQRVMLLGNVTQTIIGRPYIPDASVLVAVEEHFKDGKVHVFKMKRRKRYRRYKGPRAALMTLRVLRIDGINASNCVDNKVAGSNNDLPIRWFNLTDLQEDGDGDDEDEDDEAEEVEGVAVGGRPSNRSGRDVAFA